MQQTIRIMQTSRTLTAEQERMISCTKLSRVALAGPGSGKTTTIVELVSRLSPDEAKKTALLTFTRAGAGEIKRRLPPGTQLMFSGTTHAYGLCLLNREGTRIGLRQKLQVIDEDSEADTLNDAIHELSYKGELDLVKKEIERNPKAFKFDRPLAREDAYRVALLYHQKLFEGGQLDFDSILTYTVALLRSGKASWRPELLIVDEAQDSAEIEWDIYRLIKAPRIVFCGDVDQSIYEWRGASPADLLDLTKHPETGLHLLTLNHRSGPELCKAATSLISNNRDRHNKPVVSVRQPEGREIHEVALDDRTKEMQYVLQWVRERSDKDVAVLCRWNDGRKEIKDMLEKAGLKVQGTAERPKRLSEAIAYASACGDPANDQLVFHAIRTKRGKKTATLIKQQARAQARPIAGLLQDEPIPFFPRGWCKVQGLSVNVTTTGPAALAAFLIATHHLSDFGQDVADLARKVLQLATDTTDLAEFAMMLREEIDAQKEQGIWVSTVHRAKGLEWDYVLLPFWTQGLFPRKNPTEEDRRTAFVALTRAKLEAYITWTRSTPMWGDVRATTRSQFIREMNVPVNPTGEKPTPVTASPVPTVVEKGPDDEF